MNYDFEQLFKHNFARSSAEAALEDSGVVDGDVLLQLLKYTKDYLLPPTDMERLVSFLKDAPLRSDRRSAAQRDLGLELAAVVRQAPNVCLLPLQMEHLLLFLEGNPHNPRGRPRTSVAQRVEQMKHDMFAVHLFRRAKKHLDAGEPIQVEPFGIIDEPPGNADLSNVDRSWNIAAMLLPKFHFPLVSVSRLRNRISDRNNGRGIYA